MKQWKRKRELQAGWSHCQDQHLLLLSWLSMVQAGMNNISHNTVANVEAHHLSIHIQYFT